MSLNLESPWKEFLEELDALLNEPVELHCLGGFAVVAAYKLPRSTNDLDYLSLEPCNLANDVEQIAGQGSVLARKHKVHLQRVGVASVPEGYSDRLTELFPNYFKNLRLFVLDPYDLVLSKLGRNADRDREDVKYLAHQCSLAPSILRDRYTRELRTVQTGDIAWHDQTLEFWIEAYFSTLEDFPKAAKNQEGTQQI